MKQIMKYLFIVALLPIAFAACVKDDGNYTYLTEEEVGIIEIDTVGMPDRNALSMNLSPGDRVVMSPRVNYAHSENLRYSWIVFPYPDNTVQVGNSWQYPTPDTISHSLNLDYTVNLDPGSYSCYLLVEDPERGLTAQMRMHVSNYFSVNKPGVTDGIYILQEFDGQTDIGIYSTDLQFIMGGYKNIPHFYSVDCQAGMLPGKPLFISQGYDWYYVFTEDNCYRLSTAGLLLMEEWNEMFYDVPVYKPQLMNYINNCEFLINNGKLHTLYTNRTNDRKYSNPIGGNYTAGNYLNDGTKTSWGAVTGAINADQVIFDTQTNGFRPYFPLATSMGSFGPTADGAMVDANSLPGTPLFMGGGQSYRSYAVMNQEGVPYLYRMQFYNVLDDGDLSSDGGASVMNLSGCTDLMNAKLFYPFYNGSTFYYATDTKLYSFSTTSGQTNSDLFFTCPEGEKVTCIAMLAGRSGGGYPGAGMGTAVLWFATYNDATKEGTLYEYLVDPYSGLPNDWSGMFGASGLQPNPYITTGWGKIVSMQQSMGGDS